MTTFGARILTAVVIGLLAVSPSWARVGVASVIDGEPKGQPPTGTERVLHVGNDMEPNERVTTGANDKAHIVFLDGSSLTVGPNSVLTIDKFVYDPERKTGQLALNASRGVFRFVGGAISKNAEVTIKTPSATVGIRGGIATFAVARNGATTANFIFGRSLTLTTPGGTTTLTAPGTSSRALGGSAPPTPPAPMPPGGVGTNNSFQQTAGSAGRPGGGQGNNSPGGGSGFGSRPSSTAIGAALANSGLSRANSAIAPSTALAAVPATQQAQLKTAAAPPPAAAAPQAAGSLLAAGPQQGSAPLQAASPLPGAGPLLGTSPLRGVGPIQGASPIQAIGPVPSTDGQAGLAGPQAPGALPPILAAAPQALPGLASTNIGTLNQLLAQVMAGPNAPSPTMIAILASMLTATSTPPPEPALSQPPPAPGSTTPVTQVATSTQASQPALTQPTQSLPPTTYSSSCQSQITPSTC